jgi:cytochrome o ubiquinol oxidase subunit 2
VQSLWQSGVLDPQGPVGAAERLILLNATAIMLAIVVPVILLTLGVAWWFREGNTRAQYWPDWEYSGPVELVVWSIPALVVMFLGGIAWVGSHQLDPTRPLVSDVKPIDIQVVSLDWKWLFIYPEHGIASVNYLAVPAGTPLRFSITSAGVMNSFFVPQLGSQIYAMSGMATRLHLQADKPGKYPGLSAQFSGDGFSDMRFVVEAMPADQFTSWLAKTQGSGEKLDVASYGKLGRPGIVDKPITFGTVAPGVFESAIRNAIQ